MARLLGIAIKPQRKGEMQLHQAAVIDPQQGLHGDCRGKPGKRQLTLMNLTDWQAACDELGVSLPWQTRRANLLVDQLPLYRQTGAHIRLGEVLLEITGETDPCERMEQAQPGLFQTLMPTWRGGVTCRVLEGGNIRVGMSVEMDGTFVSAESRTV